MRASTSGSAKSETMGTRKSKSSSLETKVILRTGDKCLRQRGRSTPTNKVSPPTLLANACLGLSFVESSALNSSNVDTAFERLITSIYTKMINNKFNDRLEQFNYFGSERIRQQALEQLAQEAEQEDEND